MANKRIRGVAIHRPILIGSTSTPLTPAEKLVAPPDHTHKWTVAVRSAASHPLPSLSSLSRLDPSSVQQGDEASAAAAARAADHEINYHRLVGGRDDISHFIRRVQFKLHDTYAQPTRNVDKPPFSVTETGWGEFDIQMKIFFVPEANEKPVTVFHHLKLHPWLNTLPPPPEPPAVPAAAVSVEAATSTSVASIKADVDAATLERQESSGAAVAPSTEAAAHAPAQAASAAEATVVPAAPPPLPPVVHSWQYDEIVFPEPTETFYETLIAHPPTPLPVTSAQAFSDPSAYRSYQSALAASASKGGRSSRHPLLPPHPLHAPTGYLFDALSQEAQQAESDRLDLARISAVKELEKGRERLIRAEKALKEARNKINALNASALSVSSDRSEQAVQSR
ncbi:NuA4 histone H4 acetyltransferase complex and the SWR1 complex subunit [Thecaphora frezii]